MVVPTESESQLGADDFVLSIFKDPGFFVVSQDLHQAMDNAEISIRAMDNAEISISMPWGMLSA